MIKENAKTLYSHIINVKHTLQIQLVNELLFIKVLTVL